MNIAAIKTVGVRALGRGLLKVQKFSPEALTAVGIVGVIGAAVLASRATLKLEPTVDKMREGLKEVDALHERDNSENDVKDRAYVYMHGTIDIIKLYAPSVTLGLLSIGCIVGAQGILKKRNVALMAAYKALESSYSEYRKRVAEDLGVDKDRDYRLGLYDVKENDPKTGKASTKTHVDVNGMSPYARVFDEFNKNYHREASYNLIFLRGQQNYFNDLLLTRGHLFLNEVYEALGFEHSSAGAVVGWVVDPSSDNYVDFGIYDASMEAKRDFVNGYEKSIWLDFNVDGVIFDKI